MREPLGAMKHCLAIQHVAFEHLDGFAGPLKQAGYAVEYRNAADGLDDLTPHPDLLVVLGGPIGADQESNYPFLKDEFRLIEAQIDAGLPLLGVCLGAQLIARVSGARIYPGGAREIGFAPLAITAEGRRSCLAAFADGSHALHWHGDTFDLPAGAVRLASTDICENQAFSLGPNVIGFQFHPEATGANIEHWLIGHTAEISAAGLSVEAIREDARKLSDGLGVRASAVMSAWLNQLTPAEKVDVSA